MRNKDKWKPSKFVYKNGILGPSMDENIVGIASRLPVYLVSKFYQENIPLYVKGELLDLGCGKVPLFEVYKDFISDNICLDWGNSLHKNEFLDIISDLNNPIPFSDNSFDTIILSDVLEHIKDPFFLWREMSRVLRKDGVILLNVPFFYWIHEKPYDYFRYTEFALRDFAAENRFEILDLKPLGGSFEIMADIFSKSFIPKFPFGRTFLGSFQ